MNRRKFLRSSAVASVTVIAVGVSACGPSKEKAVKVTGFVIDLCREAIPLLTLLNARGIADLLETKGIPALEKLKEALAKADIPSSTSALTTVRNVLSGVATALMNLPESPRRTTIVGILASINVLLLTVEAFIESEMPVPVKAVMTLEGRDTVADRINRAFEATRP